jgi:hypothetical protein
MPTAEAVREWEREACVIEAWTALTNEQEQQENEPRSKPDTSVNQELQAEIDQARQMLSLDADWDGEGSPVYSKDTFDRAVAFLTTHSAYVHSSWGLYPPVPRVSPGPDGSIDLHWKRKTWELLVNIPADPSQMAVFYGDDYGSQKIKGSFDPQTFNLGIIAWLMH